MLHFVRTSWWLFRLALLAVFASLLSGFIQVSRGAQQQDLANGDMFRIGIPYTHADSPPVGSSDSSGDGSGAGSGEGSCSASGSACDGSAGSTGGGTGSSCTY